MPFKWGCIKSKTVKNKSALSDLDEILNTIYLIHYKYLSDKILLTQEYFTEYRGYFYKANTVEERSPQENPQYYMDIEIKQPWTKKKALEDSCIICNSLTKEELSCCENFHLCNHCSSQMKTDNQYICCLCSENMNEHVKCYRFTLDHINTLPL